MRVLVLDRDHANDLIYAILLSGYGLAVEMIEDIDEAAHRLSTMMFDALLCSLNANDDQQRKTLR